MSFNLLDLPTAADLSRTSILFRMLYKGRNPEPDVVWGYNLRKSPDGSRLYLEILVDSDMEPEWLGEEVGFDKSRVEEIRAVVGDLMIPRHVCDKMQEYFNMKAYDIRWEVMNRDK